MSITCLAGNGQCLMASRVYLFLSVARAAESNFAFPLQATGKLTQTLTNDWPPCGSIFREEKKNLSHPSRMGVGRFGFQTFPFITLSKSAVCKVWLADSPVANANVLCSL